MEPAILAAFVGGVATIMAAILGIWAKHRSDSKKITQEHSDNHNGPSTTGNSISPDPDEYDFRSYKLTFLPECRNDLATLSLDEATLIDLVESEFLSHMSYFVYDLEEYAMPVKAKFIVHIDKVDKNLVFKRVFSCTANEAKLASWNDILTLYRRAMRLAYRERPENMLLIKSMLPRTREMHIELVYRIVKHFSSYEGRALDIDPKQLLTAASFDNYNRGKRLKLLLARVNEESNEAYHYATDEQDLKTREIDFQLRQAISAWVEVDQIEQDIEGGLVMENAALGALVTCAERSLQYLHKILLSYPPIE